MAKHRRLAAVILAVLVLVAVTTSLFILAHAVDHTCTGEDCPVCAVISLCRSTLKVLCGTLIAAALLFACLRFTAPILLPVRVSSNRETPVTLRVKLLN